MSAPVNEQVARMIEGGRHLVPAYMWGGVERYFLHGIPGGSFMTALLSNNLMEAFACADDENAANMRNWCLFLYNYAPRGSYGSPERMNAWLAQFHSEQVSA
jgi:hypothetical protein